MQSNDTVPQRKRRVDFQPRLEHPCAVCGTVILVLPREIERGKTRYCSPSCVAKSRRSGEPRTCEFCSKPFYAKPDKIRRQAGRFCSKACHDEWQRVARPVVERLWEKVNKDGPTTPYRKEYGACWLWTGHLTGGGYGRLYRHFPTPVLAHRLAWEIVTGETLNADDVIGHICDVRACVRNDEVGTYIIDGVALPRVGHLFKGTHTANHADMVAKQRHCIGDKNGSRTHPERLRRGSTSAQAKLTEVQVAEIRRRYSAGGITQTDLGREYGVHNVTVSEIVLRKKWRHVD